MHNFARLITEAWTLGNEHFLLEELIVVVFKGKLIVRHRNIYKYDMHLCHASFYNFAGTT